jgi:putative Mn2+ efflux pump MntP
MTFLGTIVLAFSMSADAFAAAIGRGASERPSYSGAVRAGLVFGLIEAITPIIGWSLGLAAASFITAVDHWIAFGLITGVGGRMIFEASVPNVEDQGVESAGRAGALALVATAFGTSIDAAAVGVSLAFLDANILVIALAIGLATFAMATLGMIIGRSAGRRLGVRVEFAAGLLLIGLGTTILLEHTRWIG